ncbi:LOW QUALITY PROTEIN: uncharacterized protein C19orf73 homolog [Megaptera novaeangliae]
MAQDKRKPIAPRKPGLATWVKGAAGEIPAPPAPPPRRQQQEMGDARLPRTVTMDSSRAGLCPGRPLSRPGLRDSAGCSSRRTRDGQTGSRRHALGLEGGVNAGSASAPYSAPLRPPRELHVAPPPPPPTQTITRPGGLPRRARLMVRSAPPTQRPPTDLRVSGLLCETRYRGRGLGLRPQNLRVGGVVFSSDPALRPRPGPTLQPGLAARKPASLCLRTWGKVSSSALRL